MININFIIYLLNVLVVQSDHSTQQAQLLNNIENGNQTLISSSIYNYYPLSQQNVTNTVNDSLRSCVGNTTSIPPLIPPKSPITTPNDRLFLNNNSVLTIESPKRPSSAAASVISTNLVANVVGSAFNKNKDNILNDTNAIRKESKRLPKQSYSISSRPGFNFKIKFN